MSPILEKTQIVVISEDAALARLRPCLGDSIEDGGIDLRPVEEFLRPYDKKTRQGEQSLREAEELYASLRGKLIVRLIRVSLNPESIAGDACSDDPLDSFIKEWAEIERRLGELLRERAHERINFVTVLIAEEGDWTEASRSRLKKLSEGGGSLYVRRCYLMSRLLELGENQVVHSLHAWPEFLASLLWHFSWTCGANGLGGSESQKVRFFDTEGLYAWRTLKVVAGIPSTLIKEQTKEVGTKVNKSLFGEDSKPMFEGSLKFPTEAESAEPYESGVVNVLKDKAWNMLGDDRASSLGEIVNLQKWESTTSTYALEERVRSWEKGKKRPELKIVDRLTSAETAPSKMFPGVLPFPPITGEHRFADHLVGIRNAISDARAELTQLEEWWLDHQAAAKGFLSRKERLYVGVAVCMALAYGILAVHLVVHNHLPSSFLSAAQGLWLAVCASSGVMCMLLLGWFTQNWRGNLAKKELVKSAANYIEKETAVRTKVVNFLRMSRQGSKLAEDALARRMQFLSLNRIEQVLLNELQVSALLREELPEDDAVGEGASGFSVRQWLQVEIPPSGHVGAGGGFDASKVAKELTEEFLKDWQTYLGVADGGRFLPVGNLLEICRKASSKLAIKLEQELRKIALGALATDNENSDKIREKIRQTTQFDGNERRFFSVDLQSGSPHDTIWHRQEFSGIFAYTNGVERVDSRPLPETTFEEGLMAVIYSEMRIQFVDADELNRLNFSPFDANSVSCVQERGAVDVT